ncbi:type VI secretion system tip protein VgrG [Ilyomonas limi]|uniref:Type VI secretion system tip protein VgrG n=1 Tax=Ilyomonas limi TaxID=2575867 RepID=A0A4U3L687_9BACT|nr:type VI secretion system tip protein VgrG [Ilyomonas limi]TKK69884.1 type VI secretion system tip protein VgrG [Ilyomonas limi]
MPEETTIPSVETVANFVIKVNGTEIPVTVPVLSVNVMKIINKISSALIVLQDGDAATGDFPLSNGELFIPGNEIAIAAGDPDNTQNIFKGIIIKHSLRIRNNRSPQLVIECKHKAVKTTVGRKNASFSDSTDSDAFEKMLRNAGFASNEMDIESSSLQHEELVQYNCTDWDFILSRTEAIGKVILTNDEKITIKTPTVSGDAALSLLYGATIIELDTEMDSRNEYSAVKAYSWSMADQEVAASEATAPSQLEEEGNLSVDELADVIGLDELALQHAATLTADERKAWADAQLLKARLSKIRGRAKFDGIAAINPGDVLELHGLGKRFNGKAFVSGVRQDYDGISGWKTQAQFGHSPEWFAEENAVNAPKAGALIPGVSGLYTGIVTDNEDPTGEMRVRVKFPFISPDDDGGWARMALADAGNERGLFFRPEIGDEVVAGFLQDDPRHPVIVGMLNSSANPSPLQPSNDNHLKGYTSREKLILQFDDDKKEITIKTPAANTITISDDKKAITIEDQNGNKIETNEDGITLNDSNGSEIVTIETKGGKIRIKGSTKVVVEAPQIELVENGAHPLVFGDDLLNYLNQLVQMFNSHMHPGQMALIPVTPAPPVPPFPPPTPALLSFKVKTG